MVGIASLGMVVSNGSWVILELALFPAGEKRLLKLQDSVAAGSVVTDVDSVATAADSVAASSVVTDDSVATGADLSLTGFLKYQLLLVTYDFQSSGYNLFHEFADWS